MSVPVPVILTAMYASRPDLGDLVLIVLTLRFAPIQEPAINQGQFLFVQAAYAWQVPKPRSVPAPGILTGYAAAFLLVAREVFARWMLVRSV